MQSLIRDSYIDWISFKSNIVAVTETNRKQINCKKKKKECIGICKAATNQIKSFIWTEYIVHEKYQ